MRRNVLSGDRSGFRGLPVDGTNIGVLAHSVVALTVTMVIVRPFWSQQWWPRDNDWVFPPPPVGILSSRSTGSDRRHCVVVASNPAWPREMLQLAINVGMAKL